MKGQTESTNQYLHEYSLLDRTKGIRANHTLSKEELFIEYGRLADEYEAVLTKLQQKSSTWGNLSLEEKFNYSPVPVFFVLSPYFSYLPCLSLKAC